MPTGTRFPPQVINYLEIYLLRTELIAFLLMTLIVQSPAAARNPNPGVLPPNSNAFGKSYGEWSAKWWQWALIEPTATNPIADSTGEFGALNQSGKVWFLAGNTGGHTDRAVTVPAGKAIFFPIINVLCGAPEDGSTYVELLECATSTFAGEVELSASVDGVALEQLSEYKAASPSPPFPIVGGELFGIDPGRDETVSDGFWIMLAPLSDGEHEIDFRGFLSDFGFETSLHYDLTVVGRGVHAPEPSTGILGSLGFLALMSCGIYRKLTGQFDGRRI